MSIRVANHTSELSNEARELKEQVDEKLRKAEEKRLAVLEEIKQKGALSCVPKQTSPAKI